MDAAGLSGAGAGAAGPAASRQQLQAYAKRMSDKMEQQLRPILGAVRHAGCLLTAGSAGSRPVLLRVAQQTVQHSQSMKGR